MDTLRTQVQDLLLNINSLLFILAIGLLCVVVVLRVRRREYVRTNVQHFVLLDGQILDDLPDAMQMIPTPPPHTSMPKGVSVVVHLAGGGRQPRRVEEVVPLRIWRADELQGYIDFKWSAAMSRPEQRLIANEIRRRVGADAWERRSPQVSELLGAAD